VRANEVGGEVWLRREWEEMVAVEICGESKQKPAQVSTDADKKG
jgi:hypothetical protein